MSTGCQSRWEVKRMKMREHLKSFFGLSVPRYHELSTYLTALTCAMVFILYPDLRQFLIDYRDELAPDEQFSAFYLVGVCALVGFMLSILHVFIQRKKMFLEKFFMGAFAIGVSALAGIKCGLEALSSSPSILIVFPILNIVMGLIMIYRLRMGEFDVTNENASLLEISGASLILFVVFAIAYYGFHFTWAMTFSICVFYSNMLFFFAKQLLRTLQSLSGLKDESRSRNGI